MKMKMIVPALTLTTALAVFSGCSKENTSQSEVGQELENAGETIKSGAEKAASETKDAMGAAADATATTAQDWINKAKAYIAEGKHKEALDALERLSVFKLTDEQKKAVNSLKEQAKKALNM